jgi:hypothetical protein
MQSAMYRTVLCPARLCHIRLLLSQKGTFFGGKKILLQKKHLCFDFLYNVAVNISHFEKT